MISTHRTVLIFLLAASTVRADDITLTDGKVYKNAAIASHTATSVTILTDNGGAIVPMEKLPPALQKKLGYDPAQAAAIIKQRNEARAAAEKSMLADMAAKELLASGKSITARVIQVINPHEVIATTDNYATRIHIEGIDITRTGTPSYDWYGMQTGTQTASTISEDKTYVFTVWPKGSFAYTTVMGAPSQIDNFTADPTSLAR